MKPPPPKSPSDTQAGTPAAAGETQVIDLQDVELLVAQHNEEMEHARSLPPPLPPEVRASHVPAEPVRTSQQPQPPAAHGPSFHPSQIPPAPEPRSSAFYVVALLVFLAVGVGGGVAFMMTRKAPPVARAPSANAQATVITIPVVDMADEPDAGK